MNSLLLHLLILMTDYMAKLTFFLDGDAMDNYGRFRLTVRVTNHKKRAKTPFPGNIYMPQCYWDPIACRVTCQDKSMRRTAALVESKMASIRNAYDIVVGLYCDKHPKEILKGMDKVMRGERISLTGECLVSTAFDRVMEMKENPNNRRVYDRCRSKLMHYVGEEEFKELNFEGLDRKWLQGFERWIICLGNTVNTARHYLRTFRTVCRWALEEGMTENYPFKGFVIKGEATKKRSMSIAKIRELWDYQGEYKQERMAMDVFRMLFIMCGVSITDLVHLKKEDIEDGVIEFRRKKCGSPVCLPLMDEMKPYLKKYGSKSKKDPYAFVFASQYKSMSGFLLHINKRLREKFGVTTYYARHTWATMAAQMGADYKIIDMGLGHSPKTTTDIYVDPRRLVKRLKATHQQILNIVCGKEEMDD